MPPKSTQKRPASSSHPKDVDRNSKRIRFDDVAAEEAAFDDQILANLEDAPRRGAVKTEGYDSDSSDDGEGVVLSRHAGANHAADEDEDMFAPSGPSGSSNAAGPSTKKDTEKFLALGDIEGQEFGVTAMDTDDVDDDEFEDEDARERKRKEGMGFELSSFNMKAEMEEGKFAEDGTFHRAFDAHSVHDKWMDGIDDREVRRTRLVKRKMEERERKRVRDEEDLAKSKEEISKELVCFLHKGETILDALQRLGQGPAKTTSKLSTRSRKDKGAVANTNLIMDVDGDSSHPPEPTPIERLTSLASSLLSLGNMDAYEESYQSLLRTVHRSGIVPPDWTPPPPPPDPTDVKYEYRWAPVYLSSIAATSDISQTNSTDVFGPFGKDELIVWKAAAYFGQSGERILLRRVGEAEWAGWDVLL